MDARLVSIMLIGALSGVKISAGQILPPEMFTLQAEVRAQAILAERCEWTLATMDPRASRPCLRFMAQGLQQQAIDDALRAAEQPTLEAAKRADESSWVKQWEWQLEFSRFEREILRDMDTIARVATLVNALDRAETPRPNRGSPLRQAQERLAAKGFDPGPIDGQMGARTKAAIRQFQREQGLSMTGELDAATKMALGLE